jgi:hypothetical protein
VSSARFEAFLARLYVDADLCHRFLADPDGESRRAGLDAGEVAAMLRIDREGLVLASRSFAAKRSARAAAGGQGATWSGCAGWLRRITARWRST